MKKKIVYLLLSLKKSLRLLPSMLAAALVLTVAVTVIAVNMKNSDTEELASIGAVGDTTNAYVGIAATLITESDSFNVTVFDSEEEAMEALCNHEIQGFVTVPEGFVDAAMVGQNIPLYYTVLKTPAGLSHTLTREIAETLSPVVNSSQNAVYGMRKYLRDTGNTALLNSESDKMSVSFVFDILERDRLFDVRTVGVSHSLSTAGYYVAAISVLFVLICGVIASPHMIRRDSSLSRLLSSRGVGIISQTLCEWLSFFLVIYLMLLLFAAVQGLMLGKTEIGVLKGVGEALLYAARLLPVAAVISAMQFCIYEFCSTAVSGMMTQFFAAIILSYVSGLFYPEYFFPDSLQAVARALPVGAAFAYSREALSGEIGTVTLLSVLLISLLLLALSAIIRKIRTGGERI